MKYYLRIDGQQEGPFTDDEVEDLHGVGRISKGTPCRNTYDPNWKTVDDHVPRAKWVSTPHGIPPKLSSDQPSPKKSFSVPVSRDRPEAPRKRSAWEGFFDKPDRIDFGLNAVYAGIACVVLENLCGQLMLGGFFGIGGIFRGSDRDGSGQGPLGDFDPSGGGADDLRVGDVCRTSNQIGR